MRARRVWQSGSLAVWQSSEFVCECDRSICGTEAGFDDYCEEGRVLKASIVKNIPKIPRNHVSEWLTASYGCRHFLWFSLTTARVN